MFLHTWFIVSTQLWSLTLLWCDRNKIGPNQENSIASGSSSHTLVLDRLGSLIIKGSAFFPPFNQKKMWVKIQHQMEVLYPIYMAPNRTALTKITILNIHFALSNETWRCEIECFHFQNETLVNGVQDMSQKIINKNLFQVSNESTQESYELGSKFKIKIFPVKYQSWYLYYQLLIFISFTLNVFHELK